MTSTKTASTKPTSRGGANSAVSPPRGAGPGTQEIDQTIAKARTGKVTVTPAKAIAMAGKLYSDCAYGQASKVCRQIIESRPGYADAHNVLGVSLAAMGHYKEGLASLKRAIKLSPRAASYHANLGELLRQRGKTDEAAKALGEAIAIDPANAQALNNLGIIHYERGQFDEAIDCYRKALALRPKMAEAHNNLGNALRRTGDSEGARLAYENALTYREAYPEAYNNLGTLLKEDGQPDEAEHALKKAIAQSPKYIDAHNNLAALYFSKNQDVDALRTLTEALKIDGKNPTSLILTARIQLRRGNHEAAEQATRMVVKDDPANAEALIVLGQVLHETDRFDAALEVLEQAVAKKPDNAEARNFYGVALKSVGRLDESRKEILAALSLNDMLFGAYANLNDLVDFAQEDELFNRIDAIFEVASDPSADHYLPLHFAYAKALDDRGEHQRALEHYIIGGKMKRAQLKYVEAETFAFFDGIMKVFPREIFHERRPFAGNPDNRPVFIVGMPRSGSTLVEQIISCHPDVHGAGEVKYLSRALGHLRDRFPSLPRFPQMMEKITPAQLEMISANYLERLTDGDTTSKRITDKLLTNYFFIGLINLLFPNAKIINTVRSPVDTCLSSFTKLFKDDMPHSYDFNELGRYYAKYSELMKHWNTVLPEGVLMAVQYEDVVADAETQARRLIDFIGLDWNPVCLEFHKSDRPVKTASVAQVRKPIYNSSVERWKKYGDGLQPLIDALEGRPA